MNGIDVVILLALAFVVGVGLPYVRRRAEAQRVQRALAKFPQDHGPMEVWRWPLDGDVLRTRQVRASYDRLPYAGRWRP